MKYDPEFAKKITIAVAESLDKMLGKTPDAEGFAYALNSLSDLAAAAIALNGNSHTIHTLTAAIGTKVDFILKDNTDEEFIAAFKATASTSEAVAAMLGSAFAGVPDTVPLEHRTVGFSHPPFQGVTVGQLRALLLAGERALNSVAIIEHLEQQADALAKALGGVIREHSAASLSTKGAKEVKVIEAARAALEEYEKTRRPR